MTFKELKHYLSKTNTQLPRRQRAAILDTSVIKLFHNGHLLDIRRGLALCESLNIIELEDGRWQTFNSERGVITDILVFPGEESACDYFLSELRQFWPLQTIKGVIIYPTIIINGVIIRDEVTINTFWNLFIGPNNEKIENIWNRHSGKKIGRYHIVRKQFINPITKADQELFKRLIKLPDYSTISPNGVLIIELNKCEIFDANNFSEEHK